MRSSASIKREQEVNGLPSVFICACLFATRKSSLWLSTGASDRKILRFEILVKVIFDSKGVSKYLATKQFAYHSCHRGLDVDNSSDILLFISN